MKEGEEVTLKDFLTLLQTCTTFGTLVVMLYTFKKFLNSPRNTLDKRLTALELELKETKQSLLQGNDRFRDHEEQFKKQRRTNASFKTIMLAFVNFEIAYCMHTDYKYTDELIKAKTELEKYLTDKEETN